MGGVFPKTGSRSSKFNCKGYVDGTQLKNGGVPPEWDQINKALINLITKWLQKN